MMMQSTDNPNAAMYEAEEKRKANIRAFLTRDAAARVAATEAVAKTAAEQPVMGQMENDIAMLDATGAPVGDPQAAAASPARTPTPSAHTPRG
jgi:hypothetical protein